MKRQNGFTLIELILYIAIVMVVLTSSVRILWIILETQAKQVRIQEVQDNGTFAIQRITEVIRTAAALDASTVFTHPASLVVFDADGQRTVIDTYLRTVPDGANTVQIRTLRIQRPGTDAVDLTSSSVSVTTVSFTDKSSGGILTLDMAFALESVPPATDPHYAATASWTTTATVRAR